MNLADNILQINQNIAAVCAECGRSPDEIKIVAATKTIEPQNINELKKHGITAAGENRVQEFVSKLDSAPGIEWHFIGALQTNKVKSIIGKVALIHSLDRVSLADEIERLSAKSNIITNVLIEINIGYEENKSGVLIKDLENLYNYVKLKPHIIIKGFMSVMPQNAKSELYKNLRDIYNTYKLRDKNFDTLSVGMSGDYMTAVKYGATLIRPGSAIFGKRI